MTNKLFFKDIDNPYNINNIEHNYDAYYKVKVISKRLNLSVEDVRKVLYEYFNIYIESVYKDLKDIDNET